MNILKRTADLNLVPYLAFGLFLSDLRAIWVMLITLYKKNLMSGSLSGDTGSSGFTK